MTLPDGTTLAENSDVLPAVVVPSVRMAMAVMASPTSSEPLGMGRLRFVKLPPFRPASAPR